MDLVRALMLYECFAGCSCVCAVPSLRPGARAAADRDGAEGDDPPAQELQDELVVRGHPALLGVQVEHLEAFARHRRV